MDHPYRSLKYVAVGDLDRSTITFDDFTVEDPASEKLGKLEGFVIDVNSALPYYAVVNAGGWFRSKHVLIPIGHAALDSEARKLIVDVPKQRIQRFPGFDLDVFPTVSSEELSRMARDIASVCCPEEADDSVARVTEIDVWAHYRTPVWWEVSFWSYKPTEDTTTIKGKR